MADNQAGDTFRQQPDVPYQPGTITRKNGAWGGHGFNKDVGPDGYEYNTGASGYDEDTTRYQGMGAAAANAQAYNINQYWGQSDKDAYAANQARTGQNAGLDLMRGVADGSSYSLGQQTGAAQIRSGARAQQAAALSVRGGSLAQAAALRSQQNGQGAFVQQGNQQLEIQRAQERAAAREQYMQASSAVRGQDQEQVRLQQQRADAQAQLENQQRGLNDEQSMGYEKMASDVQDQHLREQSSNYALQGQHEGARAAANQADMDRDQKEILGYGQAGGSFLSKLGSDERMKQNARPMSLGEAAAQRSGGGGVRLLTEDPSSGVERHWDADVSREAPNASQGASLSGPTPKYAAPALATVAPKGEGKKATRKYTDAELNAIADKMLGAQKVQHGAQLAAGPAVHDPMTNALADGLKPYEYEYKPAFAQDEGQQHGEKNVGPMAQDMASNPITGQAVSQRPDGLLQIDMKKATKLSLAAAGHNAQKIRELEAKMGGR